MHVTNNANRINSSEATTGTNERTWYALPLPPPALPPPDIQQTAQTCIRNLSLLTAGHPFLLDDVSTWSMRRRDLRRGACLCVFIQVYNVSSASLHRGEGGRTGTEKREMSFAPPTKL